MRSSDADENEFEEPAGARHSKPFKGGKQIQIIFSILSPALITIFILITTQAMDTLHPATKAMTTVMHRHQVTRATMTAINQPAMDLTAMDLPAMEHPAMDHPATDLQAIVMTMPPRSHSN